MQTPCDIPVEELNIETGKMETHYHCPYANGDDDYVSCRDYCGLGVDE